MGMGTRLYPLPGGAGDGTKVWYPLGLGMGMEMNFFYGDGYEIVKHVPVPPRCHPYPQTIFLFPLLEHSLCHPWKFRSLFCDAERDKLLGRKAKGGRVVVYPLSHVVASVREKMVFCLRRGRRGGLGEKVKHDHFGEPRVEIKSKIGFGRRSNCMVPFFEGSIFFLNPNTILNRFGWRIIVLDVVALGLWVLFVVMDEVKFTSFFVLIVYS